MARTAKETAAIKAALRAEYRKDKPLPDARRAVESKLGLRVGETLSFDKVYFDLIAREFPILLPENPTLANIRSAVRKRRSGKDGTTVPATGRFRGLGILRWEALAASLSETLGKPVSVRTLREYYGTDRDPGYAGKGTRAAVPATRSEGETEAV